MTSGNTFATDTTISMPVAPNLPVLVDLGGGFGFGTGGLCHNITQADLDEMLSKFYQPPDVSLDQTLAFLDKKI